MTNDQISKPQQWYFQTWFVTLMLFVFAPVGIPLMWMQRPHAKFFGNLPVRIVITIAFGAAWVRLLGRLV